VEEAILMVSLRPRFPTDSGQQWAAGIDEGGSGRANISEEEGTSGDKGGIETSGDEGEMDSKRLPVSPSIGEGRSPPFDGCSAFRDDRNLRTRPKD